MRSHKEAGGRGSLSVSPNPASNGLGQNIAALHAEMRAMRDHMHGSTPSKLLQEQASQPGPTPSETRNAVRSTLTMPPEPILSSIKLAKTARTV